MATTKLERKWSRKKLVSDQERRNRRAARLERKRQFNETVVTKEEFERFEKLRESNVTNMHAISTVMALADLDRDTIKAIIDQYEQLAEKYKPKAKEL